MTANSYRSAIVDLLTDPMQLALDLDHAEGLVGQIEDVLDADGWDIRRKESDHAQWPAPKVIFATRTGIRNELVVGVIVERYTVNGRGCVWAEMPCCDRHAKLPMEVHAEFAVRCLPCRMEYAAWLIDENDGGYLAVFKVLDDPSLIWSQRRRTAKHPR
ncbi:hypothetical protein [Nonomuraea sp. SYSU D8015]|uniref:hypothetical protein n=1 Tax=Nonomuraea sp. SYSU D8015 TaxID=2593644 RepID=UPI001660754D|nr:hypothetical protein [Nonomuraea sp. SYSU D8015]